MNFSDLDLGAIQLVKSEQKSIPLNVKAKELVHLLLSSKENYQLLGKMFTQEALFEQLLRAIEKKLDENTELQADIFYFLYKINPKE